MEQIEVCFINTLSKDPDGWGVIINNKPYIEDGHEGYVYANHDEAVKVAEDYIKDNTDFEYNYDSSNQFYIIKESKLITATSLYDLYTKVLHLQKELLKDNNILKVSDFNAKDANKTVKIAMKNKFNKSINDILTIIRERAEAGVREIDLGYEDEVFDCPSYVDINHFTVDPDFVTRQFSKLKSIFEEKGFSIALGEDNSYLVIKF